MEEDDEGREESLYKDEAIMWNGGCTFWSTVDVL